VGRNLNFVQKSMETFVIQGDSITLAQAVKSVGLADSGGQAKHLVRSGKVTVNGAVEVQPGRKLHPGDRFGGEAAQWLVSRQTGPGSA
jgi:ribosome-associated protein